LCYLSPCIRDVQASSTGPSGILHAVDEYYVNARRRARIPVLLEVCPPESLSILHPRGPTTTICSEKTGVSSRETGVSNGKTSLNPLFATLRQYLHRQLDNLYLQNLCFHILARSQPSKPLVFIFLSKTGEYPPSHIPQHSCSTRIVCLYNFRHRVSFRSSCLQAAGPTPGSRTSPAINPSWFLSPAFRRFRVPA
jgi:hypothetical protein